MAQSTTVEAIIRANVSQFVKGMETASGAVNDFKKKTDVLNGLSSTFTNMGLGMTAGVTAPLAGVIGMAVKTGNEFEAQMSRVQAIAGATGDQLASMTDQAMKLGASTSFSASEVAEGMENMASAGFTVEEIMASMAGVLDLAAVSGGDVAMSSEAVATSLRQFGLDADQAGHVANVFARAAADTNAETVDMAEALKYAGPVANTLGLSLEETASAIGIMADMGIKGSQAGTTLRGAFTSLANPTKEASELMEALGINVFDANGNMKPMGDVIENLKSSMGGMTAEQKASTTATLFGRQAMSGMLGLIEAGPDKFNALNGSLENSTGSAKEMADIILNNVSGAIEEMGGALETAGIKIQQILAPAIKDIIERVTELINKFNNLSTEQQQNILKWVGIAMAIGPVLVAIGAIFKVASIAVTAFKAVSGAIGAFKLAMMGGQTAMVAVKAGMTALMGPVGWVTVAILALIAGGIALWQNWDLVKEKAKQLGDFLKTAWNTIKTTAIQFMTDMATGFVDGWNRIKVGTSDFITNSKQALIDGWNNIKTSVVTKAQEIATGVQTWWTNIVTGVQDFISNSKTAIVDGWNTIKTETVNKVMDIYNGVILWFKNLWTGIKETFTGIKETALNVWNSIKTGISTLVGSLIEDLTSRFGWIGEFLSTIWDGIKMVASGAWELIKIAVITPVLALLQIVTGDFEGLRSSLSQIWEKIKLNASLIWTGIQTAVTGLIDLMVQFVVNLITNMKNRIETLFNLIKTTATNVWTGIKTAITDTVEAIKTFVTTGFTNMKTSATNLVNNTKTAVVNGWNNLKTGATTAVTNMKNAISNFFTQTKTNAVSAVENTKTQAVSKFNQLKDQATTAISNMKTNVINWFNNTKTSAINSANNMKDSVVNGFRNMVSNIGTWVSQIPGKIRTAFSNAISAGRSFISNAVNVGRDLIGGFISGITQKAKDMVNAVKGAVGNAIAGAKNLLGIKSPSKVFAYFAKMTTKGYGDNIKKTQNTAIRPMENLMNRVKGVFSQEDFNLGGSLSNLSAKADTQVDYVVSDNMNKTQPQVIHLDMGGKTYRAYIDDLTKRQDRAVKLEEVFL